ncbi:MAG: protein kinase [Caldilineaceae bacterium]
MTRVTLLLYLVLWPTIGFLLNASSNSGCVDCRGPSIISGLVFGLLTVFPVLLVCMPKTNISIAVLFLSKRRAVRLLCSAIVFTVLLIRHLYAYTNLRPTGIELFVMPLILGFIAAAFLLAIYRLVIPKKDSEGKRIGASSLLPLQRFLVFPLSFISLFFALIFVSTANSYLIPLPVVILEVVLLYLIVYPVTEHLFASFYVILTQAHEHPISLPVLLVCNSFVGFAALFEMFRAYQDYPTTDYMPYVFMIGISSAFLLAIAVCVIFIWKNQIEDVRVRSFLLTIIPLNILSIAMMATASYFNFVFQYNMNELSFPGIFPTALIVVNALVFIKTVVVLGSWLFRARRTPSIPKKSDAVRTASDDRNSMALNMPDLKKQEAAQITGPQARDTWEPGSVIAGLYRVEKFVGQGFMGTVHRVHHLQWDLDLAVKTPSPKVLTRKDAKQFLERLESEAYQWSRLGLHPNLTSCFYVRTLEDGIRHLFIEFVDGESLTEWISQGRFPNLAMALDVGIQICWGMGWAHSQGMVHLDLKPDNILMTLDGTPKVTDFGLVRAMSGWSEPTDAAADTRAIGGTPGYAAPEQRGGEKNVIAAADVYALGVVLYELLQQSLGLPKCPDTFLPRARPSFYKTKLKSRSDRLSQVLLRSIASEPEERYADAATLAEDLTRAYKDLTGVAYLREKPDTVRVLADGLNNRALSMLDLDKQSEAEDDWQAALNVDPTHPESVYNHGLRLWRSARTTDETLVQQMENVCTNHADEWKPLVLLAQIHLERKDSRAMQAALDRAQATLDGVDAADAAHTEVAALRQKIEVASIRCLHIFTGHTKTVTSVRLSTDGCLALSGSRDRTLRLWDLESGKCLRVMKGHAAGVTSVCLSADARLALSGSADATLRLWDLASGQCLRVMEGHIQLVTSVNLSTDGRFALSGSGSPLGQSDNTLRLWDVASGQCLRIMEGHTDPVLSVCFSADGHYALSGSVDKTLRLWDVETGCCLHIFWGHTNDVNSVCLSADRTIAFSGSDDFTVRQWDVATGQCLCTFTGHNRWVSSVSLSADGCFALSGSENTVRLWNVKTGQCLRTFEEHAEAVRTVNLSADSSTFLSGSDDLTIQLWDVDAVVKSGTVPPAFALSQISGGGEKALTNQATFRQTLSSAQQVLDQGDLVRAAQAVRRARFDIAPGFEHDRDALALWQALSNRLPRKTFRGAWLEEVCERQAYNVYSVCLSADGRLALSDGGNTPQLWDVQDRKYVRTFEGHTKLVSSVHLSPDERYVLSGSGGLSDRSDNTLRLWDFHTGECLRIFKGHTGPVNSVCLREDNRLALSGSVDRTLRLWDVETGICLRIFRGHIGWVNSVCLSADGRYALSGSGGLFTRLFNFDVFRHNPVLGAVFDFYLGGLFGLFGNVLRLWDIETGRCLRIFRGHTRQVTSVTLSADGRRALSGSADTTLRLWDIETGQCLRIFKGHTEQVSSVCLSADARFAVSGSWDRTLRLWDIETGKCLHIFRGHTDLVSSVCLSADGCHALSGSWDRTLRLWALDWELEDREPADWDEGARPYLQSFLALHTPREQSKPSWSDEDFQRLLKTLGFVGFGWLRPEGVRRKLAEMAAI